MMVLCSDITIGGKRFRSVAEVEIRRSVDELAATATVTLPASAVLRQAGLPATRIETAQAVRIGDPVVIRLGYDGRLEREFVGYVRRTDLKTPVVIECEDEFYRCRRRKVTLSGTLALRELLSKCGLAVAEAETLTIANFVADDKPVSWVLAKIRTDYGLSVFFDMDGRIHACRAGKSSGETVRYEMRRNVISGDRLQYQSREDVRLQVKAVYFKTDGERVEVTVGDKDAAVKTLYFYDVASEEQLRALAEDELARRAFDGYTGAIETFLRPYAAPGMVARLADPVYPQRDGDYLIDNVRLRFGRAGGRRTVGIGRKL